MLRRAASLAVRRLPAQVNIISPPLSPARALSGSATKQDQKPKPRQSVDGYLTANVLDLLSLKGRTIIITGAGRGIGLALAFAVAEAGGKVAIVDAAESPHEYFTKLEGICERVGYYKSDVTDYDRLQTTFASIIEDFGRIDGMYVYVQSIRMPSLIPQ